jgi:hypothetical protein
MVARNPVNKTAVTTLFMMLNQCISSPCILCNSTYLKQEGKAKNIAEDKLHRRQAEKGAKEQFSLLSPISVIGEHILPLDSVSETYSKILINVCNVDALVITTLPEDLYNFGTIDRYCKRVVGKENKTVGVFFILCFVLIL